MNAPLTELERIVLSLVAEGGGNYYWRSIAVRLSMIEAPREPGLMEVLSSLKARGLIASGPGSRGYDTLSVTRAGAARLET